MSGFIRRGGIAALVAGVLTAGGMTPAPARHLGNWSHDHSLIPYRPRSLAELRRHFGGPACNSEANDARTWFPSAVGRDVGGYVLYHPYLSGTIGRNIRMHIDAAHKDGALDYGIYGYSCRQKTGGTSWSVHAWGAAIDTNTARNPYGQGYWNGIGADGRDHGTYIPDVYRGPYPGHGFYWGRRFSTPDPHHFQFVTNY